jgi:hypothetical protein
MTELVDGPARSSKLSITSLVLAIVVLAVFWSVVVVAVLGVHVMDSVVAVAPAAGVILGVAAVVTGIVARRRVRRGQAGRGGVALAGIVFGVVAAVVPAVSAAWAVYLLYAQYQEFEQCIRVPETASPRYLCLKECPGFLDSLCRKEIGW